VHLQLLGHNWTIHRAVLFSFGIYVLSGLRPRSALALGMGMAATLAAAQLAVGRADPAIVRGLVSLLGANLLGASAAFGIERSARTSFMSRLRLRELAERDGLTGLYNRRHLDDHLGQLHRQARREKADLAVAMIDVDDFKAFNDARGHPAGDACLGEVARALESCVRRPFDLVARYGGEEFCAVWYGAERDAVRDLAERCRRSVVALQIEHPAARAGGYVSVSIGAAVAPATDWLLEEIVAAADAALYTAKEQGRDCTVVARLEADGSMNDAVPARS